MRFLHWLENTEELKPLTLDNKLFDVWQIPNKPHQSAAYSLNQIANELDWWNLPIRDVIKITYEKIKKAAWTKTAEDFGYSEHFYRPHPPQGWEDMSDSEKRAIIYERSIGLARSVVYELQGVKARKRNHYGEEIILPSIPPELVKWVDYLWDEVNHDPEVQAWEQRSDDDIRKQQERWTQEAKEKDQDAEKLAKALWRNRHKLSGWEDATEKDALITARAFIKANPYERSQYQRAIKDIANKLFAKKKMPVKDYYMQDQEAEKYLQSIQNVNVKTTPDNRLVDIFNKTVGITDSQDVWQAVWGENVPPSFSAQILGHAAMLRVQAAGEIGKRIVKYNQDKDQAKLHAIYFALDQENRKMFFKV